MQYKTSFTHRSTVKLNNVQKSDAMTYICVGESTSLDTIVNETYKLVVHGNYNFFVCYKIIYFNKMCILIHTYILLYHNTNTYIF